MINKKNLSNIELKLTQYVNRIQYAESFIRIVLQEIIYRFVNILCTHCRNIVKKPKERWKNSLSPLSCPRIVDSEHKLLIQTYNYYFSLNYIICSYFINYLNNIPFIMIFHFDMIFISTSITLCVRFLFPLEIIHRFLRF